MKEATSTLTRAGLSGVNQTNSKEKTGRAYEAACHMTNDK